ncbi:acyltransferase family protein [Hoeflea sp. E7-10]|uniref:Acyltransferase family protein n=2 Tax=Hoeflea poritis TaxID=2993659 RepID=A0ABT4VKN5_9HYPH|nr:acyltransferase family protein [Hoeflea poritis]MDA4845284.1 acyltransferase family protein [Hoeflea poritis]
MRDYVHLESGRVVWVDYLKGFCILLVVMLHSVAGVEKAAGADGWMHIFVEVSQPMRMPAFFLASGLFFMRGVDKPLGRFLDTKVLHFAYFYVLWLTIQFAFKAPGMAAEGGLAAPFVNYLLAFVQPFGTLWFIYILPVFFIVTRLVRTVPVPIVLAAAVLLQVLPIHTGAVVIDEFASYFVWFFAGYALSGQVFALADFARRNPVTMLAVTIAIMAVTWFATRWAAPVAGLPDWVADFTDASTIAFSMMPVVSLILGIGGVVALVSLSAVLSAFGKGEFIRWCGAHSIVIYLAFFLPMAVTRVVLLKLGVVTDIGTVSLLVWIAAVAGPVLLFWLVQITGLGRFLFERPRWARLSG